MLADFSIPVIETYRQLAVVLLGLAVVIGLARVLWLVSRATHRFVDDRAGRSNESRHMADDAAASPNPAPFRSMAERLQDADRREFDRLAGLIANVSSRAERVSETQNKAALKLDTVEMAMHRLLADIDGIMTVPHAAIAQPPAALTGSIDNTRYRHSAA